MSSSFAFHNSRHGSFLGPVSACWERLLLTSGSKSWHSSALNSLGRSEKKKLVFSLSFDLRNSMRQWVQFRSVSKFPCMCNNVCVNHSNCTRNLPKTFPAKGRPKTYVDVPSSLRHLQKLSRLFRFMANFPIYGTSFIMGIWKNNGKLFTSKERLSLFNSNFKRLMVYMNHQSTNNK